MYFPSRGYTSFNSTLVQLKEDKAENMALVSTCFNSTLVQLKVYGKNFIFFSI